MRAQFGNENKPMKVLARYGSLLLAVLLLAGCASGTRSTAERNIDEAPEWYLQPPSEEDMLLTTATAESRSMQIAIDKAKTNARGDIAQQLQTQLDELERQFSEDLSQSDQGEEQSQTMEQFTQVTEAVASETLVGSQVRERKLRARGDRYRAWVLMEMPIGEARSALLEKINGNEEMRTRMRSTEAFKQLEEEVEEYNSKRKK